MDSQKTLREQAATVRGEFNTIINRLELIYYGLRGSNGVDFQGAIEVLGETISRLDTMYGNFDDDTLLGKYLSAAIRGEDVHA